MRWLKLRVFGRKAIVPTSITDEESTVSQGTGGVRNGMAYASNNTTNVIPNRTITTNRGKYTAPPQATPFAVIPNGVCKNC